ncbi:MAG: hypothetical protein Q9M36_01735 [Sulfurovum sp.]|nr:hypothetical protein [Sulfurovum sp.]
MGLKLRMTPVKHYYLTAQYILNLNEERNIYYQPEYYYTFGYEDYAMDTWGWGYANYGNNRFSTKNDPHASSFHDGSWNIHYKTKFGKLQTKSYISYTPAEELTTLSLKASYKFNKKNRISAQYEHYIEDPQERLTIKAKSKFYKKFFVEAGIYLYSDKTKQEDYESDYYYAFGWKDNRKYHFSVIYSNEYIFTRFPSNGIEGTSNQPAGLSISFNF